MILACRVITNTSPHEAGLALLEELYRTSRGGDLPPIRETERGKPYFEGESLQFSISHTKRHVFVALSDRPIGVDAEEMDRPVRLELADKILSAEEKLHYDAASDKRAALLRFWVLKEALVKCTGEGLRSWPNDTAFSPDDPRVQEQNGCYVAVIEGEANAV